MTPGFLKVKKKLMVAQRLAAIDFNALLGVTVPDENASFVSLREERIRNSLI